MASDVHAQVQRLLGECVGARFPGAVAQWAIRGRVAPAVVVGDAVRWLDDQHELPVGSRPPMTEGTMFDIASLTKVFTAVTALRVLPRHGIRLDDPVAAVLEEYRDDGRRDVTWRQLLTHTSGLPPTYDRWREPRTAAQHLERVLAMPLEHAPGTVHAYSCVGYITAGVALERVSGRSLRQLVADEVCRPLHLTSTGFGAVDGARRDVAATEYSPERGVVRGVVHDETAWVLGGVSGNAGLFSTAGDMLGLGLAIAAAGGDTLLDGEQRRLATSDQHPPRAIAEYGQAIGLRMDDPDCLPPGVSWCGHSGFTGTSLVLEPGTVTVGVLLTNRVHPRREFSDIGDVRRRFASILVNAD